MTDYYKKYINYKRKYINLKIGGNNEESLRPASREVDWYLFFDLWQVSKDIIYLTNEKDIIILVGDTPSYLISILKLYREVYVFAFSDKPFGCFKPPYGRIEESESEAAKEIIKVWGKSALTFTPSKENLQSYFNYLDTKTKLTRKFITEKWKNIVLVDSSSGSSIHGISIFFNRYIGNIKNKEVICKNIENAKPLRFIRLSSNSTNSINLDPKIVEEYYPNDIKKSISNYRPDLIIYLGSTNFYFRDSFMIEGAYPRIVPFYDITAWKEEPDISKEVNFEKGFKNIELLEKMAKLYLSSKEDYQMSDKDIKLIEQIEPHAPNNKFFFNWLEEINTYILVMKHKKYFRRFSK